MVVRLRRWNKLEPGGHWVLNGVMRGLLLFLICGLTCVKSTNAQSGSVYFTGGTAVDSSAGPVNTLGGGTVYNRSSLGGFFGTIGGDVRIWHGWGVGAEYSFKRNRDAYAGLSYRPEFYDVNAVYQPVRFSKRRLVPKFEGGFGRMVIHYYDTPQFCQSFFLGCKSLTGLVSQENYLQIHFGAAVQYYVYKSVFVRPEIDIRYMHNMVDFGSPVVPEFSVGIGYTIRRGR
jgi:hypothetical protein